MKTAPSPQHAELARFEARIAENYLADESSCVAELLSLATVSRPCAGDIHRTALQLSNKVRQRQQHAPGLQAFLRHYDLSSHEGVVLMCIAEALLRIPDSKTMDALILDRLSSADWQKHLGTSDSLFVNASTWALMLGADTLQAPRAALGNPRKYFNRLLKRLEEPVVRAAMKTAMRIMAWQFVMGRSIGEALKRSRTGDNQDYRYSFDMLGEAAITGADATRYQGAYSDAITAIGNSIEAGTPLLARPGISIKLSALYPRYEYAQKARAVPALSKSLLKLAVLARQKGIALTVDAEEAERLEMSLQIFQQVLSSTRLAGWNGLGLAVQAYQKRCLPVLRWLECLAELHDRVIPLRLVKGAYWDTEIKRAQEDGLADYPVFTRKSNTDVAYQACARYLLRQCRHLYPQFATHNAQTLAYVYHHRGEREFEFQRLHGMGEELYEDVIARDKMNIPCRVYAPVGAHRDLLPYLVRRLLENGANTSFVRQMADDDASIEALISDPLAITRSLHGALRHPAIPLPGDIFGAERRNSAGINFADDREIEPLLSAVREAADVPWRAAPLLDGREIAGVETEVYNPADGTIVGRLVCAAAADAKRALDLAWQGWPGWNRTALEARVAVLEKTADLYQRQRAQLLAMCVREGGKTIVDSHAEVREAIDFLRYYAARAKLDLAGPLHLPGPTGESNTLLLQGRGIFFCISPWNFPLAIYTGQIAAALVSGNTVLAKPAEQTSLLAACASRLFFEAGLPVSALQFLPGDGATLGRAVLDDPRIAGVAFTGSTATARAINQALAARRGPIAAFIAETGGQNTMLVDSSALPEQVVLDVVQSAFNSAGQRCSALRVLYLQEEIAEKVLGLLKGHMDELVIGDPAELHTDIGPVIDSQAKQQLQRHIRKISATGKLLHRCRRPRQLGSANYVMPVVVEIGNIAELEAENFGPVLHVIRYRSENLHQVLDDINDSGYGLTLGIHSRIEQRAEEIRQRVRVGNIYVNRGMTGAVVGVQPFGGCGLSGTGPKAGGPHYLLRFVNEQTCSVNTSAIGGNASLLTIG